MATNDGRGGSDDHHIAVTVFSPLASQEVLTSATEHVALPGSTTVATFTDTNTSDLASGFTASINWGDGTATTTGTVTGSNGSFSVAGGHTYPDEGNFGPSVLITRTSDGVNTTANGTVGVAENDALTPQGATIGASTNQPLNNVVVATFSDADTVSPASDFFTSINWGDGTTTGGSVSGSGGAFTVTGSHTYTAPGTDNMHVTLTDDGAGTATATANSTANVVTGALASQEVLTSATEHVALAGSTTVATFTDTNANDLASGFTATINWGDGSATTTGTVTALNGSFSVAGGHTYTDEASAPGSVLITRTSDSANTTANGTVTVAEQRRIDAAGHDHQHLHVNQPLNNVVVATFSDADTANAAGDFSASITWGDGTTTTGSVSGSGGSFTVRGSHAYTAPGTDNVHVTLSDDAPGTATATANSTVNVAVGALASQEVLTSATEHVALADSTTVATFTDTNTTDLASGFSASIDWGDSITTTGTVSGSNGSFSVDGGHTYLDEASAPVSVSITRTSDNANTTANGTVSVAEHDALTPQGTTINTFANQPLNNVVVATFSDADTASPAGDLPASINWGDGTTTTGSVSGSGGSFTVTGSHTYTAPGTDNVHVTLSDDAPGTATATANSTVNVAAGALASQEVLTSATEHVALADSTTVATFTDTNSTDLASGFAASINWGDGTTTTGSVSGSNGSFTVDGGHTYLDEASAPVSVSITRTSDNANTTATGTVSVAEHDGLTAQGATIDTFTNQALNNVVVATFSDSDTATAAGDLPASIAWGDGTTTTGSVSGSGGSFTVTGSHTYTAPGTDNVHVTLSDDAPGTATATANSTVNVSAGTLASQEVLTSAMEHVALGNSTTVATFTDTNPTDQASGFTATIDWGDGITATGIVSGSNGSFSVDGGHTYTDEASAPVSVSITRTSDNANTTANGQVSVAEHDALTPQGTTIGAATNQALNNVVVATFSDADTANAAGDFAASIDWGDGTTTGGSVSSSGGSYTVTGSHTPTRRPARTICM